MSKMSDRLGDSPAQRAMDGEPAPGDRMKIEEEAKVLPDAGSMNISDGCPDPESGPLGQDHEAPRRKTAEELAGEVSLSAAARHFCNVAYERFVVEQGSVKPEFLDDEQLILQASRLAKSRAAEDRAREVFEASSTRGA